MNSLKRKPTPTAKAPTAKVPTAKGPATKTRSVKGRRRTTLAPWAPADWMACAFAGELPTPHDWPFEGPQEGEGEA